jgi:DNA-binding NtrC family response regulator
LPQSDSRTEAAHAQAAPFSHSLGLAGRTLADVERDLILETLAHCGGNRTHTATTLGISIRTLRNKLKEYARAGIAIPRHPRAGSSPERGGKGGAPCA